jgi:hypothetical protein
VEAGAPKAPRHALAVPGIDDGHDGRLLGRGGRGGQVDVEATAVLEGVQSADRDGTPPARARRRQPDGTWATTTVGAGGRVGLASLDIELAVAAIYRGVDVPALADAARRATG